MTTTPTTICRCGHVLRVHSVLEDPGRQPCNVCVCEAFREAQDAAAATEAARASGEHRERTYNQLRTAVARHRFDDARRLLDELAGMREGEHAD